MQSEAANKFQSDCQAILSATGCSELICLIESASPSFNSTHKYLESHLLDARNADNIFANLPIRGFCFYGRTFWSSEFIEAVEKIHPVKLVV